MKTKQKQLGKTIIRWQQNKDGTFSGTVIIGGKAGDIVDDDDEDRLIARLHNEAGKQEPNYFGMDAAIARFLEFMPGGFEGDRNLAEERQYKVAAHNKLNQVLTADKALDADSADAKRIRSAPMWINLLSPYEAMHLKACLEGDSGSAFLRSAAKFAAGNVDAGAEGMRQAMKPHGALTWPIATYFPYLWDPNAHMFLKPSVTTDFAQRIGHPFQYLYASDITREVYDGLLALAVDTKRAIAGLHPSDNIDVQSFIWVIGAYTEVDKPK